MSEEFGINSAFRDSSTVHGKIFLRFACTMVVNDAGENLFTHAILALDEDRKINGGNLERHIDGSIQAFVVAHDIIALFDFLKLAFVHMSRNWSTKLSNNQ